MSSSPARGSSQLRIPMGEKAAFAYDRMHNIISGEDALGHTLITPMILITTK